MDDLMDLLTYDCPYTGKKRVAGCEDGELYINKYLGSNPDQSTDPLTRITRVIALLHPYLLIPLVWWYLGNTRSKLIKINHNHYQMMTTCSMSTLNAAVLVSYSQPSATPPPLGNMLWLNLQCIGRKSLSSYWWIPTIKTQDYTIILIASSDQWWW